MRKHLLFAFVLIACAAGSSSVDPEKYDRTCKSSNDCVLIATDACCQCPSAAINVGAQTQYAADLAAAEKNCGDVECAVACVAYAAACSAGVCVVTQPPADAGSD